MRGNSRKSSRQKNLTSRYLSGGLEDKQDDSSTLAKPRFKNRQKEKTRRTGLLRADAESGADIDLLPVGEVHQVYSLFCEVAHAGKTYRCVLRRTLTSLRDTYVVVGDQVHFREIKSRDEFKALGIGDISIAGRPLEGVVERILPRKTVLTRADSFKGMNQHPIVANAGQMLIVVSLREPAIKWGLVDRMLVAAQGGGLKPVVCLNKIDLIAAGDESKEALQANEVLAHYESLGILCLRTSVTANIGLESLKDVLREQTTVLAGHSGVGKSSLIRAIQPHLDLRVAEVSRFNDKGRHTTTSARHYPLDFGGVVIDTPGVKLFGLWGVHQGNLAEFFPDVADDTAPEWRRESYQRISGSLRASD